MLPLRLTAVWLGAEALSMILMNSLMGAGASGLTMKVSVICQWGIVLTSCPYSVRIGFGLLGSGVRRLPRTTSFDIFLYGAVDVG